MIFWAKYNTQTTFSFPIVKRAVVDLAVSADWTPAAADSAISKDQASFADTSNTVAAVGGSPTRTATGWKLTLTATELSCAQADVQIVDAATKVIEDQFLTIYTYGNASAKFAGDWSDIVRLGLTSLPNAAAEAAGGLYTRGTNAGQITQPSNGLISVNATQFAAQTITAAAGVTLPSSVASPTNITAGTLTTVTTATNVTTVNGLAAAVITAASIAADAITDAKVAADVTIASVTGAVGSVTGAVGSVTGAVGSVTGNVGGNVTGTVGSVVGAVGSVTGNVGGNVSGSVGSVATGGIAAASFAAGAIDSAAIAANAIGASELAADAVDEILDETIGDGTITMRQALRVILAATAGKLSGAATTTVTIRNTADTADVVVATVTADGNRTAVTLTP